MGLLRQGPTLTSANLRYRLRTLENLSHGQRPMATLALAHSDQANRRAVRTLGGPTHHRRTFVATEGELLAGDQRGVVWQQCGNGTELDLPVEVAPGVSLNAIMAWIDRVAGSSAESNRQRKLGSERKPRPNPETLYPGHLRAAMPEPSEMLRSSLAVRLTGAEKDALDMLAAWPLCTTDQLAGLMGGVTRRRVNQVLSSLAGHFLVRADGQRHVLTDDGLTCLARRDRAAVGPVVGRWSARKRRRRNARVPVYAGTALRAIASQMEHHDAITGFAAALSAETARSRDYQVLDLMPTSRSAVGYRWDWTNYVVHPDASFQLAYQERWRFYLLEFERRATTPRRVRTRLENYRRYFNSGWPNRDHGGLPPLVLFVFPTPDAEEGFLHGVSGSNRPILFTSNLQTLDECGVLGDAWQLPPRAGSTCCGPTRCRSSGSGCWPSVWTPWPCSTKWQPWSPTPTRSRSPCAWTTTATAPTTCSSPCPGGAPSA